MKHRNVFLFAVIFSAGIASAVAEEPADENMRRETTYLFGSSVTEGTSIYTPSFSYRTAGDNADETLLSEHSGLAGTESGRDDYSAGYKNDGTNKKKHEDFNKRTYYYR